MICPPCRLAYIFCFDRFARRPPRSVARESPRPPCLGNVNLADSAEPEVEVHGCCSRTAVRLDQSDAMARTSIA
jgi:hypothetical protein